MVVVCQVSEELGIRGLQAPELEVLKPTEQTYRALLLQPAGPILADQHRIGHLNRAEAKTRCTQFLTLAAARGIQLVVTPEYCLPTSVLLECVQTEMFPKPGAIWVLGCESMTSAELEDFKTATAGYCDLIYEVDQAPVVQGTYFDPVAYCFMTKDAAGALKKVVILQFKTCPSRDPHSFENTHLRIGTKIYQFKNDDGLLALSSIICSDAFVLGEDAALCKKLTDRATLLHIQLNPDPRHADYRKYRKDVFSRHPTFSNCDIVCLNWARDIVQHDVVGDAGTKWKNIGGSAWYLPEDRCSTNDNEIHANDLLGLYYSRLEKRRHVLLFHYDDAAFELTVPKLANDGPAVIAVKIGPQANARYVWDTAGGNWVQSPEGPDPGFDALLSTDAVVEAAFATAKAAENRLSIERVIALSCGPHGIADMWQKFDRLEYCQMKVDEVVPRTTFCMDTCMEATTERHARVQQVAALNYILANEKLPLQISDLGGGGAAIVWSGTSPNTNIAKEGCRPALVAYLGFQPHPDRMRGVADAFLELLRKEGKAYQHRVAVCFRKTDGTAVFVPMPALTRIDHDGGSLADITGALE